MAQFNPGKVLKTVPKNGEKTGSPVKILSYIGGGGQGDVYMVEHEGKKKALKWYKKDVFTNPKAFYDNLIYNVNKGSPDEVFLWPEAVVEKSEGSFGYIMPLRPNGYFELSKYTLGMDEYQFSSFKAMVEACIKIVSAFRILHIHGYSYQDLNDGNFFINPNSGDVLICDNDNVAPNGTSTGVLGMVGFMAPEVTLRKALPSVSTDAFSLSIILFMVLCMNHPLEGKKTLVPCLTPAEVEKIYGSEALFIFDPNDRSNAPVKNLHMNAIDRWGYLPDYVKDAFIKSFSQEAIKNPNRRLSEVEWLQVLARFRSEIVKCSCGNEVFIINASTTKCDACGKPITISNVIKLPRYSLTAVRGTRIYRCQLGVCNADVALEPIALVVANNENPKLLGVRNMTDQIWSAITVSGKKVTVEPGEVVPFMRGIVLEVYGKKFELA